jgi:hypothetical protein
MDENDVADIAATDSGFELGCAQPHDALKRKADNASALHGGDDLLGLRDSHRHRFAEDDVLSRSGGQKREVLDLGHGGRDVDDVDLLSGEKLDGIVVALDAKGPGERVELRCVV